MGDPPTSFISPPPPSTHQRSSLPMLYYGLVVVGTAAIVLAVYNIIIIKWCTNRPVRRGTNSFLEVTAMNQRFPNPNRNLLSSFKYRKEVIPESGTGGSSFEQAECAVCLSVFEDGEEIRQLPRCKHSFHTSCIDMWLFSHSDCPLCRSPADPLLFSRNPVNTSENSREVSGPLSLFVVASSCGTLFFAVGAATAADGACMSYG